jgi:hypothetical protein
MDEDKVDLVIGGYGTNTVLPAMNLIMERQRFFIGLMGLGVNNALAYPNYFAIFQPDRIRMRHSPKDSLPWQQNKNPGPKPLRSYQRMPSFRVTPFSAQRPMPRNMGSRSSTRPPIR